MGLEKKKNAPENNRMRKPWNNSDATSGERMVCGVSGWFVVVCVAETAFMFLTLGADYGQIGEIMQNIQDINEKGDWQVIRQDSNAVKTVERDRISQKAAEAFAQKREAEIGFHKQTVWAEQMPKPKGPN